MCNIMILAGHFNVQYRDIGRALQCAILLYWQGTSMCNIVILAGHFNVQYCYFGRALQCAIL